MPYIAMQYRRAEVHLSNRMWLAFDYDGRLAHAPLQRRAAILSSLVRDGGTRRAGEMDYFEALETDFATPFREIRRGIIECVAEFDQHVERHEQPKDILSSRIIDQRFNRDKGAAGWKRFVCCANELHLFPQVPIVQ